jgi:LCP family protein required for cell wall assembly
MRERATRTGRTRLQKAILGLGIAFGVALILTGVLLYVALHELTSAWSSPMDESSFPEGSLPDMEGLPTPDPLLTPQVGQASTPEAWSGDERINILVMGLDRRSDEKGPGRSDAMIVLSVDPATKTAGMISIPRDVWVDIPGFGANRINTAYFFGDAYRLPQGGPGLAMQTVENFLGLPINYYVAVEFGAFERMIDEIGGIDLVIEERLLIQSNRGVKRWLEAGENHLDGFEALAYVRNRSTARGDFDREQRQQHVVMAILDRVTSLNMVPTMIARAPILFREFSAGVRTNLEPDQILSLALLAVQIPLENVKRGVIAPPEMVVPTVLESGAQVLIPVYSNIRMLCDEVFSPAGAIDTDASTEDLQAAARAESAIVAVLNGAGKPGIASETAAFLVEHGLVVGEVGNATRNDYEKTLVVDYTGNPYTTLYLIQLMNLSQSQILAQTKVDHDYDVVVIIGRDWQVP